MMMLPVVLLVMVIVTGMVMVMVVLMTMRMTMRRGSRRRKSYGRENTLLKKACFRDGHRLLLHGLFISLRVVARAIPELSD